MAFKLQMESAISENLIAEYPISKQHRPQLYQALDPGASWGCKICKKAEISLSKGGIKFWPV